MPFPEVEPFQSHPTMSLGLSGIVVLSSTCRLLFIDRNAIAMLSLLESDPFDQGRTEVLPACLMTLAQEIITTFLTSDSTSYLTGVHVRRLIGSPAQPVRVQGFMVARPQEQGVRIVLVLSQWNSSSIQEGGEPDTVALSRD